MSQSQIITILFISLIRNKNLTYEGKGVIFSGHAMKAYRGSSGIAPLILNLGIR
jgi:hypothetical protein